MTTIITKRYLLRLLDEAINNCETEIGMQVPDGPLLKYWKTRQNGYLRSRTRVKESDKIVISE